MRSAAEEGFTQLSRRFRPALMAFFMRRVRDQAEAEDLTQEVFARLSALPSSPDTASDAYIFQIAANLVRDRSRREKVRNAYRDGLLATDGLGVEPLDPERFLTGREELGAFAATLKDLPDRTREIFVLYRVESMKKQAIAETFGITVSGVNKHLMKAMALMIKRLEQAR